MGWKGKNVYMLVFGIFLICSSLKDGNIFKNSLDIKIGIPEEDILRFEIYSIDGRKIYSFEKFMKKGWHKLKINIKHNGIYILKILYDNKIISRKIIKQ